MDDARLREIEKKVDALASSVTRLVKAVEDDDVLQDKVDRAEDRVKRAQEEERDERYERMLRAVSEVTQRVETLGVSMRDLPRLCFEAVERKILELRTERWEAQKAGIQNEPSPLPPVPSRRGDPTGRQHALQQYREAPLERDEPHTGVFALHHRDGERRQLREVVGGAVIWTAAKSWRWVAATGAGAAIAHVLHRLGIL